MRPWRVWTQVESVERAAFWKRGRGRFFFDCRQRATWSARLVEFDRGNAGPVSEAGAVAQGMVRYFGFHDHFVGLPPNWFRNPWTGVIIPRSRHWAAVNDFAHGDIKIIWELSRFGWVYPLVRAYWRTGDSGLAEVFWTWLESWRAANPPNTGPNWRCGQEASIRLMAWVFALWAFEDCPSTTDGRVSVLLEMLEVTGERIESHLDYALSQENNHGISEATGLLTLGLLFPWWRWAARWEARGREVLARLAGVLIYDDGGFSQHSFNYQRLMLHDYAWAARLAQLAGRPLDGQTLGRIGASTRLLASFLNAYDGSPPNHGANDGARILPLDNTDYPDCRGAVQMAGMASGAGRLCRSGPWDESVAWLFGFESTLGCSEDTFDGERMALTSGYAGWRGDGTDIFLHVPQFRHRPAHADLLHCDIAWKGRKITCDPGTYSYNAPPPFDQALAGTRFHNTVEVDGRDQMNQVSRFIWIPWPRCSVIGGGALAGGRCRWLVAEHEGYLRLADPVRHQRRVIQWDGLGIIVQDVMRARSGHRYRLHWCLVDSPYRYNDELAEVTLLDGVKGFRVQLGTRGAVGRSTLIRGSPGEARGWESTHYLALKPCLSVDYIVDGGTVEFWSLFIPDGIESRVNDDGIILQHVDGWQGTVGWLERTGEADVFEPVISVRE